MPVDQIGIAGKVSDTLNEVIDLSEKMAQEFERISTVVGKEGKLTQRASLGRVDGSWAACIGSINTLVADLVQPSDEVARVIGAVANGDLSKKITVDAKGEILELKNTINTMVDQLNSFASEVTRVAREVGVEGKLGGQAYVAGAAGTWRDLTDNVNRLAGNLTTQVRAIGEVATAVTKGDLSRSITVEAAGEVAALKDNVNEMIRNLKDTTRINMEQDWLKTNLTKFTRLLQGQRDLLTVSRIILSEMAPLISMQHGVFYIGDTADGDATLKLLASYGYQKRKQLSNQFKSGEGLVGQCLLERQRILLTEVPSDYIRINSGLGEAAPLNIVVLPVLFEGEVMAVIELASFQQFSETHLTFLDQLTESIGIVLNTIVATMRTEELLKQSQSLAGELQNQQRELTETNKRLEQQARSLKESEDLLKQQQEELRNTNEELEEKARLLAQQNAEVERKNREIDLARLSLEEKAEQLTLSSRYKSEFLANMSHELRTPLNSMLILSKMLSDNPDSNLLPQQVDYMGTIYSSGVELLGLINDILDLSKIESGTMDVEVNEILFADLQDHVERAFRPVAQAKALEFTVQIAEGLPKATYTDWKRLQQVLKNLLSNAFKFTERGSVALRVAAAKEGWDPNHSILRQADLVLAFSVSDTGIGISADKQQVIFEAFQQADGTTSRKYGGTGLGLSISREIACLLGGEIRLTSRPGEGSTFVVYLPRVYVPIFSKPEPGPGRRGKPTGGEARPSAEPTKVPTHPADSAAVLTGAAISLLLQSEINDDRGDLQPGDRVLLIVENDIHFARILLEVARNKGFKGIVALRGETGLTLARQFKPSAITLDILMPEMNGWMLLDILKHDPTIRHIPIYVISVVEEQERLMKMGAFAYLMKPITREDLDEAMDKLKNFVDRSFRSLLIVEGNEDQRAHLVALVGNSDVHTTAVSTGAEALAALGSQPLDGIVLGLRLPDMTGAQLLEKMRAEGHLPGPPIIVYTEEELTGEEETELRRAATTLPLRHAASPDRLLEEITLYLHRAETNLPEEKRRILQQAHRVDPVLAGKTVLVVDDDTRNIFAITSVLQHYHMKVFNAENAKDAIALLWNTPEVHLVLMDVMMPEMDGYETARAIWNIPQLKALPIIALTAKAMKGDREKCIEAGMSDYIAKPVDPEQLLSLLRVWLDR